MVRVRPACDPAWIEKIVFASVVRGDPGSTATQPGMTGAIPGWFGVIREGRDLSAFSVATGIDRDAAGIVLDATDTLSG